MKKILILFFVLISFVAIQTTAQEWKPPKPLDSSMAKWLVGKWKGHGDSPMGKTEEYVNYSMGLDNQYLLFDGGTIMKGKVVYRGIGASTIDLKSGKLIGWWMDNTRGNYKGEGKEEGNKMTMTWKGPMGESVRITEKVGPDKMKLTVKMFGKNYYSEYTRVK